MAAGDDELEALRRRKLAELQQHAAARQEQDAARAQQDAARKAVLRQLLTPEARERLTRVSMAYPEVAQTVEDQLLALYQTGRVRGQIDDATFKRILAQLAPSKKDIKIERR
ncbi:MAG TPA: DNA-binding protein [Candidatus Thermoplasmatota archaeon]|nr:DNA-binding protein [Candidatus Thermoplasmatota archaeon]